MDIVRALELLKFESLDDVTDKSLTKAYRTLMREHHPDLYFNNDELLKKNEQIAKEINEAHEILSKILGQMNAIRKWEELTKKTEIFAIIPFQSLFDLYNGKTINLRSNNETFKLTKSNIRLHRIILCIECSITHNNATYQFSTLKPAVFNDDYSIDCDIPMTDDTEETDIDIVAYNKNIKIALKNNNTRLKLRYDNSVVLTLNIRKKIITESDSEKG